MRNFCLILTVNLALLIREGPVQPALDPEYVFVKLEDAMKARGPVFRSRAISVFEKVDNLWSPREWIDTTIKNLENSPAVHLWHTSRSPQMTPLLKGIGHGSDTPDR